MGDGHAAETEDVLPIVQVKLKDKEDVLKVITVERPVTTVVKVQRIEGLQEEASLSPTPEDTLDELCRLAGTLDDLPIDPAAKSAADNRHVVELPNGRLFRPERSIGGAMPNGFKSKKNKAAKGEPIRPGFHPIDKDALEPAARGGDEGGGTAPAANADVTSPARSDGSIDEPPLRDYPDYGRDGLLSTAFTGDTKVLKLMLALGPEVCVDYHVPAATGVCRRLTSVPSGRPSCTSLIRLATLRSTLRRFQATKPL
jgi:hypothetical protein